MIESLKHIEAFEYYFSLGDKRSLISVARKFNISVQSTNKWNKAFDWQKRIEKRNIDVSARIEKKSTDKLADIKSRFRADTQEYISLLKKAINQTIVIDMETGEKKLNIDIEKPADLEKMLNAFDKLVKLDLLLAGEAGPEEKGLTINFIQNNKLSINQETEKELGD